MQWITTKMQSIKTLFTRTTWRRLALGCGAVVAFWWFVWPTPYIYTHMSLQTHRHPLSPATQHVVRIHRVWGTAEILYHMADGATGRSGWYPPPGRTGWR